MASSKDFATAYMKKEKFEDLSESDLVKVCEAVKSKVVADDAAGTVTYNLAGPVPYLFAIMSQQFLGGILDSEWMKENADWDGECGTWSKYADPPQQGTVLFNNANGTGPYQLDHWTPGEEIVLTAFKDYWRTEPMWEGGPSGVAKISRVVFKNIDEWGTRLSMFEAGDADYIYTPAQYRPQLDPYIKTRCYIDETSCKEENANGYIKAFRKIPQPAITPAQMNWISMLRAATRTWGAPRWMATAFLLNSSRIFMSAKPLTTVLTLTRWYRTRWPEKVYRPRSHSSRNDRIH